MIKCPVCNREAEKGEWGRVEHWNSSGGCGITFRKYDPDRGYIHTGSVDLTVCPGCRVVFIAEK